MQLFSILFLTFIFIRDERVQHYLYLYLLTIWIICICIRTRTGRGLTRKWAGFNREMGRVVLKWAGLSPVCYFKHAIDMGWSEIVIFIAD